MLKIKHALGQRPGEFVNFGVSNFVFITFLIVGMFRCSYLFMISVLASSLTMGGVSRDLILYIGISFKML